MKQKKKVVWVALILVLLLALTGCSQDVIYHYEMKMQAVQSMQMHSNVTFQLSGTGFNAENQKDLDVAAGYLNNAKLDYNIKTNSNKLKTTNQSQVDMNLALQGMDFNMTCWVDSDLSSTPEMTEIIKLPSVLMASAAGEFAGKEYIVYKPFSGMTTANTQTFMDFMKNAQVKEIEFLTKYLEQYNPSYNLVYNGVQTVQTPSGLKEADIYEIKLNDAQFKELIRYTVNNFVQNPDAMAYMKDLLAVSIGMNQSMNQSMNNEVSTSELNDMFANFDTNKTQFLAQFNQYMDKLNTVTLLGDKGIDLKYAIADGYIINENEVIHLNLNMAQLNQLMIDLGMNSGSNDISAGTVDLIVNINTDIFDINTPQDIQFPTVNDSNSIDYQKLLEPNNFESSTELTTNLWLDCKQKLMA